MTGVQTCALPISELFVEGLRHFSLLRFKKETVVRAQLVSSMVDSLSLIEELIGIICLI